MTCAAIQLSIQLSHRVIETYLGESEGTSLPYQHNGKKFQKPFVYAKAGTSPWET